MKKILLSALIVLTLLPAAFAREYSYLNPPSISIMDFDVNMIELVYGENDEKTLDRQFFGQMINQTLLTILIQKNSTNDFVIDRSDVPGVLANPKEFATSRYFPTLLKIYDKKYVEDALGSNNYAVSDLYNKKADAFNYTDLDFVVLGNVYETGDSFGVNVRVLNTARGEELFSYIGYLKPDISNLHAVMENIAENIITDILKNYCSQFIIKVKDNADTGENPLYFCQSRQEYDNEDNRINYNDTFKKDVFRETYYWILPGDYVFTVYSGTKQSVHEIPVTINPREIKVIEINDTHFEVDTGSLVIGGIAPTDAYSIEIREKVKDAKYLWEIGKTNVQQRLRYRFTFNNGEFYPEADPKDKDNPFWVYNAFSNEISISNLMLSQYDVSLTPVAESIKRKGITGIVYISSKEIETSDEVSVDLERTRDISVDLADFNIRKAGNVDAYRQTRITFLFDPAFEGDDIDLFVESQGSSGYLLIRDIEKLVIEDEYSQEEWEQLSGRNFLVTMRRGNEEFYTYLFYDNILAENDRIVITEFKKALRSSISINDDDLPLAPPSANGGTEEESRGIVAFFQNLFGGKD